ncbi:hypothetical protein D3C85_1706370 [compost metagenome]
MTLQDHAQGVTDQQDFHAGATGSLGEGRVVAGQHGYFLTLGLEALQGGQGYIWHEKESSIRRCEKRLRTTRVFIFWNSTSSCVMFGAQVRPSLNK